MKIPNLWERVKGLAKVEHGLGIIGTLIVTQSFALTWIIWDSLLSIRLYIHQKLFPDQTIRLGRLAMSIGILVRFINPIVGGLFFIGDGAYSIYRYRIKKVTVNDIEDMSRFARIGLGSLLLVSPVLF